MEVGGGGAGTVGDEAFSCLGGVFEFACAMEETDVIEGDEEVDGAVFRGLGDD